MSWIPSFKLYASNGITLVYEFEIPQSIIGYPADNPSNIEITNLRSQGSINIPGGFKPYDITINGILVADDYTSLTEKIMLLHSSIVANTNYILRIDKSSTAHDDIRVKRVTPIIFDTSYRTESQKYQVTFKALAW